MSANEMPEQPRWAVMDGVLTEAQAAERDAQLSTETPTAQEAVLREIIDWCHLQPGNYPNWMDRARQAVGDFEGDPGQPPQPSVSVAEAVLKEARANMQQIKERLVGEWPRNGTLELIETHQRKIDAALCALKGGDA